MDLSGHNIQAIIPKYFTIKSAILEDIQKGRLKKDDILPPEKVLQEKFNVSRITVKRALDELSSEGYLYRIQGRGTFVRELKKGNIPFSKKMISCSDEIKGQNMVPSRKVIKKDVIQCDAEVSKLLNIEIGDPVLHFCRVYYADEIPINYSDSYISLKDMLGLEKFDLEKLSLMHIMQNEYGLNIELIGGELEATVVKGKLKEYLKINEGFPLIKMTTVSGYNKRGLQHYSEYVISYYRTDTIKLTIGD